MHAAYRNVPPENKTHNAVEEADERAGMAPIRPYVTSAAKGDAEEKASKAFCDFCQGHLAVMKLVARPNATGALCSTIATAIVIPNALLSDLVAAPTANPSVQHVKKSCQCAVN